MFRYFIVVDDIWDISIWKSIRCALPNNEVGYTTITTTHISDVAEKASPENSRKLFFRRIFGNENKDNNEKVKNVQMRS